MKAQNQQKQSHTPKSSEFDGSDGYARVEGSFDGSEVLVEDARAGHKTVLDLFDAATQERLKQLSIRWGVTSIRVIAALVEDAAEDLARDPEFHPDALMAKGIEKLEGPHVQSIKDLPFFKQND
jgi:hypothetical protein